MDFTTDLYMECLNGSRLNISLEFESLETKRIPVKPLISARAFYLVVVTLSCLLIITANVGIVANLLVLATYRKIGFSESINISYFALGLSDIGVLGTTMWGAILNLLELFEVDLPFAPFEISSPTMYWPGEGFEKTTSCITAYIALERCLCVLFPLHVKRFMSCRKTTIIVSMIFALVFGPSNLEYVYGPFKWKFNPRTNKTILGADVATEPVLIFLRDMMMIYINTVVHFTALFFIWICSIFLAVALTQNVKERESNFGQISSKVNVSQTRNKRVIKTVLLIAALYLVFSTPKVLVNILTIVFTDYMGLAQSYFRTYMISIIIGVQISLLNSSVNLLIYIKTSSKFRETFQSLLSFNMSSKT